MVSAGKRPLFLLSLLRALCSSHVFNAKPPPLPCAAALPCSPSLARREENPCRRNRFVVMPRQGPRESADCLCGLVPLSRTGHVCICSFVPCGLR
ncbi:hypothetical protein J3F83DRAFT_741658 [Trichoderma novae-zelandiae]